MPIEPWFSTVFSEMPSSRAMSFLGHPIDLAQGDDLAAPGGQRLHGLGQELEFLGPGDGLRNVFVLIQDAQLVQIRQRKRGMPEPFSRPLDAQIAGRRKKERLGRLDHTLVTGPEDSDHGLLNDVLDVSFVGIPASQPRPQHRQMRQDFRLKPGFMR